jgi:membrane-bound lytic murein transglycosylase B
MTLTRQPGLPTRLVSLVFLLCTVCAPRIILAEPEDFRTQLDAFVSEMVQKHELDRERLQQLMDGVEFRQDIIDAISRPAEAKPWYQYRPIFLTPARIQGGVVFWDANAAELDRAQAEYGVPPEIIVAILGVETRYGGFTGRHRVIDALATLAFGYPKRGDFFRRELEQFLLLANEEALDPTATQGSYAGAMGKAQFISSSYRNYAVDFNGDGRRDLWDSNADAIGSVANYFKSHGWQAGQPVTVPVKGAGPDHQPLVDAGMKPSHKLADLRSAGIEWNDSIDPNMEASLILLETEDGPEYWLGLPNFYTITRYNHSNLYAMAVYQLSQEIRAARQEQTGPLAY